MPDKKMIGIFMSFHVDFGTQFEGIINEIRPKN